MSKSVHYRLPDQLLADAQAYAKKIGVTVTDLIIQGLHVVLERDSLQTEKKAYEAPQQAHTPVIKSPADAMQVIGEIVKRPSYSKPLHHPTCVCGMCKSDGSK